jgi:1,4-dihydroxy-2-naphthoate octaprenyltransferase
MLRALWLASRPKTLSAGLAPVVVGAALALAAQSSLGVEVFAPDVAVAALLGALLIQIATNYANDLLDFRRGADTEERLGPLRVTQAGLLSQRAVAISTAVVFALAAVVGLYIVWRAGWPGGRPILLIGVAGILSGILYTAGPFPLAYVGLGDLFVLLFFGIAAVAGTYYAQVEAQTVALAATIGLSWMPRALALGVSVGALSMAILNINNLRDIEGDRAVGKRTMAVRLGADRTRVYYEALIAISFFIPLAMVAMHLLGPAVILVLGAVPLALEPARRVRAGVSGRALNPILGQTARLQLAHALLLSLGLVVDALAMGWIG